LHTISVRKLYVSYGIFMVNRKKRLQLAVFVVISYNFLR